MPLQPSQLQQAFIINAACSNGDHLFLVYADELAQAQRMLSRNVADSSAEFTLMHKLMVAVKGHPEPIVQLSLNDAWADHLKLSDIGKKED